MVINILHVKHRKKIKYFFLLSIHFLLNNKLCFHYIYQLIDQRLESNILSEKNLTFILSFH